MKKTILIFFLSLLTVFAFTQEHKSIHQIEWEAHLNDSDPVDISKITPVTVDSLQEKDPNQQPLLTHAVFGYLPDWEYSTAPQYFNYSVLSHIAMFDFLVNPQGNITQYPNGWPNNWLTMMNTAHAKGVKLIMCVAEFHDDDIHALINSTTASNNFYQNVANILITYNLDGVNIDFEGPQTADRGAPMNNFMQGLTDYIKTNVGPEQEISFAGPAVNWSGWDLPGLVDACDYVFIMGYGYFWNGASLTGPCAPITGHSRNLEQTIINESNGYGGCDRSKLILGLPYYGNKWQVSSNQISTENATTLATGSSIIYAAAIDYYKHYRYWSTKYNDSWTYYAFGDKCYQVWCNDAEALDAKEKLILTHKLKGMGMWALGYDEEHMELWKLLNNNFLSFSDSIMIEDFEDDRAYFYRDPNYSSSTAGIDIGSRIDTTSTTSFSNEHSLKIILSDNGMSYDDWKVRLLSGSGSSSNNLYIDKNKYLCFSLKTGQDGVDVAVMINDENDQLEISERISVIGDNQWHSYGVRLDSSSMWSSYNNGNGQIDANLITLDAFMFYSDEQPPERTIYLDAVRLLNNFNSSVTDNDTIPRFRLFSNHPNPFNTSTSFHYSLNTVSEVQISLYNILGQHVETIFYNKFQQLGEHHHAWDGQHLSSGLYIAVFHVNESIVASQKLLLVK